LAAASIARPPFGEHLRSGIIHSWFFQLSLRWDHGKLAEEICEQAGEK
jgi:hypothetical protein